MSSISMRYKDNRKRRRAVLDAKKQTAERDEIILDQQLTDATARTVSGEISLDHTENEVCEGSRRKRRLLLKGSQAQPADSQRQLAAANTNRGDQISLPSPRNQECEVESANPRAANSRKRARTDGARPPTTDRGTTAPIKRARRTPAVRYVSLSEQLYTCPRCKAIMWFEERVKKTSTRSRQSFSLCCSEGTINLPVIDDPPEFLRKLLDYTQKGCAADFRQLIRMYNSCFQFTSMGAKVDKSINKGRGCYVFRISGQFFRVTTELQLRASSVGRQEGSPDLDPSILSGLKQLLDDENPLAHMFRTAGERLREHDDLKVSIKLLGTREDKPRVYNKPTASEVAALIVGDTNGNSAGRDIIIDHRNDGLQRINELHPSYMALQYPLLFPYGEDSFYLGIRYNYDNTTSSKKKRKRECVTMREYYAYRLQQRLTDGYALLRGGKLLQQFIVDCCCAIETERLWFIRNNQSTIRCDMLNNICDAVRQGDYRGAEVGMRIFLPSSFTGGPRYMQANYQDAMAICRFFGNPHLFITFTANPKWPEVDIMLQNIPGQRPEDRPDIMTRVFRLKLTQLMDCLKRGRYFGEVVADVYTIEFQKRGLPHAHILLWLKKDGSQVSPDYIDSIIQAEIPDEETEPELYNIVSQFMVHGPCGESNPNCSCMVNDTCSKKYPKKNCEQTTIDRNGYPVYRRRENKRFIQKGVHKMDNRHIVPYNPGLLLMFNAHINVEWCNTARAIKYLFKYILKGPDKATMVLRNEQEDEISTYLDCRYLSACEASWRIFGFDIHERSPSVMRLPVHLPGEQYVVLSDTSNLQGVINRATSCETKLMGWFRANEEYPEARHLTYAQFPTEYVWKDGCWIKRSKGKSIGRIAYVHPTAGERYYLRLLLNIVKGPTSFEDLRTIDKKVYSSYKETCYAYGLLSDDKEWHEALNEANSWVMPSQLRELFVTILLFCEVTDIKTLWERSYNMLSDDIERKKRRAFNHPNLILQEDVKRSYTLIEIDKVLMRYGKSLKDIREMPLPIFEDLQSMENKLIREEQMYDHEQLQQEWSAKIQQLNKDQLLVYEQVIDAVNHDKGGVMFLYGHGGTGKTFLYSTLSAKLRADNKIVLNVASSGIAALLLPGGRTAHNRFEIPIDLFENSTCNISQKSQLAELIRMTSLIIWDEAPMDNKFAYEALDRTMRDIMAYKDPEAEWKVFGGKVVLLGGDFRQVLPIIPKGSRQDVVQASISRSYIWEECKIYTLKTSMRVSEGQVDGETQRRHRQFNEWLLAMGGGKLDAKAESNDDEATWIEIPREYIGSLGELKLEKVVSDMYPDFAHRHRDEQYLRERAILTPLNETADYINSYMTGLLPGSEVTYRSCDEICTSSTECEDHFTSYPTEYLNSLALQGLPHHELNLKVGMPVILLRNISPVRGLCNGTRLIITRLGQFIVEGKIITGSKVGQNVIIPRIVMTSSDTKIPFILKRRQYPLRPCYAMTINKSQGQSLDYVGVYLPKPVFSHGQLYVAASRTTSPEGLKFYIDDRDQKYPGHTRNIVYKEVFTNLPN